MGRTLENKKEIVAELKEKLSQAQMVIVIDYKGLSVAELTNLRKQLRPTGTECKVTKNTLMRIAVESDATWQPMQQFCKESSAFLLIRDDIAAAYKVHQDFQKATKKTIVIRGGVMQGIALTEEQIKAVTELPPKEQLMAQVAGALKVLPSKLAVGVNAVPTKLAVGIKEVPASLVRAIKAVSEKDGSGASGSDAEAA
jgi:large subunit ribosomal protein L10